MGEKGVLVLAMVKQNNRLHNKYIVVLAIVKFSKSPPKKSKSSLPPMWGGGFGVMFGASLSPHKKFSFRPAQSPCHIGGDKKLSYFV